MATSLSVLDVGTGGADIPVSLLADAARHGRSLRVEAIDSRAEVIEAARLARPALDRVAGLSLRVADGLALPYPDGAFDVAHCSMVVHHLEPADAVALLREMAPRRAARRRRQRPRPRPALLGGRLAHEPRARRGTG